MNGQDNRDRARGFERIAIGYLRTSTDAQAESGVGMDAQAAAIEAYARDNGYSVPRLFREAASATGSNNLDHRPQLWAALDAANKDDADLLVSDFGRLTRTESDISRITQKLPAHRIISVQEAMTLALPQAAGRLAYHQKQGEEISARTKSGMQRQKAASGIKYGNPEIMKIQVAGKEAFSAMARTLREALADLLEELGDDAKSFDDHEFARLANSRGLCSAQGKSFDARRIKVPRRDAEEILRQRQAKLPANQVPARSDDEPPEKKNPNWGRF